MYKGWTGTNCTDDTNECDVKPGICEGKPNSTCKNSIGSYICVCDDGYREKNGTCEGKKYNYIITENCFLRYMKICPVWNTCILEQKWTDVNRSQC